MGKIRKFFDMIARGAATFSIFPPSRTSVTFYNRRYENGRLVSSVDDSDALASDWRAVGEDLDQVFEDLDIVANEFPHVPHARYTMDSIARAKAHVKRARERVQAAVDQKVAEAEAREAQARDPQDCCGGCDES